MEEKSLLLVEDNPDDEALMLRALKKNRIANQIVIARDGVEALDYLFARGEYSEHRPNFPPQLILLDLKLPKIDGFEVLRQIRINEFTKYIPVVVLTTSSEQQDIIKSYDLGANSFVRKPIDFNEFIEATRQLGMYWLVINETVI
jgi:two-component system response regulator